MKPYYEHGGITIFHGDCRDSLDDLRDVAAVVMDPPYGIAYQSGRFGVLAREIVGDEDTSLRDAVICQIRPGTPMLVFGSWKQPRPAGTHTLLVWDTKGALGMGDLSVPWKPSHQEIYVIGKGFTGRRDTDVLSYAPVQSTAANGRVHPHQKPVDLLIALIAKCPETGAILDPFCGSGSALVAAKNLGRRAIGVEIEERYCEIAAKRLSQEVLDLGG